MNAAAITTEILSLSFIAGRIHRDGAYTFCSELHIVEPTLRPMVRDLLESGIVVDSFEWFCELNRIAGYEAVSYEQIDAEYISGNRAAYIEIWDAIACWSYFQLEQLRPSLAA